MKKKISTGFTLCNSHIQGWELRQRCIYERWLQNTDTDGYYVGKNGKYVLLGQSNEPQEEEGSCAFNSAQLFLRGKTKHATCNLRDVFFAVQSQVANK